MTLMRKPEMDVIRFDERDVVVASDDRSGVSTASRPYTVPSGTTIDMESSGGKDSFSGRSEYQEHSDYRQDETFQRADRPYEDGETSPGFKVYRMGGGLLTWIIFALIILGIFFFLLPAFLFVGIIGAVAGGIIIFLSRLFK